MGILEDLGVRKDKLRDLSDVWGDFENLVKPENIVYEKSGQKVFDEYEKVDLNEMDAGERTYFNQHMVLPVKSKTGEMLIISDTIYKRIPEDIFAKYSTKGRVLLCRKETITRGFSEITINLAKSVSGENIKDLISNILAKASDHGASDIHFTWMRDKILIRYRVSGDFDEKMNDAIDKELGSRIQTTFMTMSGANEYDTKPIDAKFTIYIRGVERGYRLAASHTVKGYSIVVRAYNEDVKAKPLAALGYAPRSASLVYSIIEKNPYGLILVTGPTGSGKTTSLYSMIDHMYKNLSYSIKTVEDPVEIEYDGIDQVPIISSGDEKHRFTYLDAIVTFLRQDPDVILIGEMRNPDIGEEVIRAALTGHIVMTTLHTNSLDATLTRLFDLGIEKNKIEDSLVGIINQRLVSKLCECKLPSPDGHGYIANKDGCEICCKAKFKGYHGVVPNVSVASLPLGLNNFLRENFIDVCDYEENLNDLFELGLIDDATRKLKLEEDGKKLQ